MSRMQLIFFFIDFFGNVVLYRKSEKINYVYYYLFVQLYFEI